MSQQMTFFGFYIDIFELGFCLHTEQVVELTQDDPKTAQLRAAGFIGEDYDEAGPKPNTLHNFIESTDDYKRVIGITEPESLIYFGAKPMDTPHFARLEKLSTEIDDVQEFLAYWQAVSDPEQLEEAPGRIAMLETDLANLETEYKALINDRKTHA